MATKPSKAAPSTEVAELAFGSVAVPDYIEQGQNRGSEEVQTKDMVLPRLEIVQALSPIKDELGPASEGQLFNSVTATLYGDSAFFIPVFFRVEYLLWYDQDSGGGFGGSYASEAEAREALKTRMERPDNEEDEELWEVVDTPVHYGLLVDPNDHSICQQIVISMAKTKAKVSRKWNAMIQMVNGDRFSRVYRIGVFKDKNKKNKEFYNFTVANAGYPIKAHYEEALRLYEIFKAGAMRAAHETVHEASENGNDPISRAPADEARRGGI